MMEYILGRLISYGIKYEKVDYQTLRIYGNFEGYSVVRYAVIYGNNIEVDGKLYDEKEFEDWLIAIIQ